MILNLFVIFLLTLINGFFALAELAIVSARPERLQTMVESGNRGAKAALEMAMDPSDLLSTAQVGITLVAILSGAYGGATLSAGLAELLAPVPVIGPYSGPVSFVLVVGAITLLSVVVGELVPKRLALQNPEAVGARVARPMSALSRLFRPIVSALNWLTEIVLRMLGVDPEAAAVPVTEEEINLLLEQGAQAGVIQEAERDLVASVFQLGDRQLRSMMTPRKEIIWLDVNRSTESLLQTIRQSNHTQLPVSNGELDRVLGIVRAKDVLAHTLADGELDLSQILQPPLVLPETMLALRALERFKEEGVQIALLVDEFGGVEGLVTLIDILEAIVGDIPTQDEMIDPPIVTRADGSLLIDGMLLAADLKTVLQVNSLPEDDQYQTLAGFVLFMLGHLPHVGEAFEWRRWRFEIVDMDGNRVDRVLVSSLV